MGFEATASIPLPLSGFVLQGAVQAWNGDLAYLPEASLGRGAHVSWDFQGITKPGAMGRTGCD